MANTANQPSATGNAPSQPPAAGNAPAPGTTGNARAPGTNVQPPTGVNNQGKGQNVRVSGRNNRARRGRVGKKDNIQKFFSKNGFLIGVIIVILVSMGTYYWHAYQKYKDSEESLEMSKIPNVCPDYWVNDSGDQGRKKTLKCINEKAIGICNLSEGNRTKDFSGELYKDPIAKCKWSKFCNSPWEGYDHLCADI